MVFGDDDDIELPAAPLEERRPTVSRDDSDSGSDSDSDDAPEAVGMSSVREAEQARDAAAEE